MGFGYKFNSFFDFYGFLKSNISLNYNSYDIVQYDYNNLLVVHNKYEIQQYIL